LLEISLRLFPVVSFVFIPVSYRVTMPSVSAWWWAAAATGHQEGLVRQSAVDESVEDLLRLAARSAHDIHARGVQQSLERRGNGAANQHVHPQTGDFLGPQRDLRFFHQVLRPRKIAALTHVNDRQTPCHVEDG
jgi:hypothetical protein